MLAAPSFRQQPAAYGLLCIQGKQIAWVASRIYMGCEGGGQASLQLLAWMPAASSDDKQLCITLGIYSICLWSPASRQSSASAPQCLRPAVPPESACIVNPIGLKCEQTDV